MINLKEKIVLITGGSRGIGAACVKLFYQAGATVIFTYNSDELAAERIITECANGTMAFKFDLSSQNSINELVTKIEERFGRIDILVNNAGVWTYGKIGEMENSVWNETIHLNLTGLFQLTNRIVPLMQRGKFGRIINVSSTAAQRGEAYHSHYAASKGAVNAFTKSLAAELGEFNITVNAVAPGWVDTDMCIEVFNNKEYKSEVEKSIPVGRIASPDDVAGPILFLASKLARHINGEILNVNGGSVLCG